MLTGTCLVPWGRVDRRTDAKDHLDDAAKFLKRLTDFPKCPGDTAPVERKQCRDAKAALKALIDASNKAHRAALNSAADVDNKLEKFDSDLHAAKTALENGVLEKEAKFRGGKLVELNSQLKKASSDLQATRKQYGKAAAYLGMWSGKD